MKKTQYLLAGVLVSGAFALTGCGGSDGAGSSNHKQTAGKVTVVGAVGQTASIGAKGALARSSLSNNTYYARYAYCLTTCRQIKSGVMHFKLNSAGNAIDTLTMDALGTISLEPQKLPVFTAEAAGTVSLESSSLRKIDGDSRIYNLQANPATSTDHKMPYSVDIKVHISKDGKSIVSADDDYLFVAQQMAHAPSNWTQTATKSSISGYWKAFAINSNNQISDIADVQMERNVVLRNVARAKISGGKQGTNHGAYLETGYGYVFGYNSPNEPLKADGSNGPDNPEGFLLLSPDNSFGISYDSSTGGGAGILTR